MEIAFFKMYYRNQYDGDFRAEAFVELIDRVEPLVRAQAAHWVTRVVLRERVEGHAVQEAALRLEKCDEVNPDCRTRRVAAKARALDLHMCASAPAIQPILN